MFSHEARSWPAAPSDPEEICTFNVGFSCNMHYRFTFYRETGIGRSKTEAKSLTSGFHDVNTAMLDNTWLSSTY